jgi:3-oxoacyl-[acyl-carrier-protein] synthase II
MRQSIPIAVTGLGLVCPLGNSVPAALARARAGESAIRAFESPWIEDDRPELRWRIGGTVEGFTGDGVLEPRFAARQEPGALFAMAAAAEALAQARLEGVDRDRIGTAIGSGLPGAELWHRALRTAYEDRRPEAIARCTAMAITGNAPGGLIAIRHGLRGPSFGVANACAAGATAIALGADQLRLGRADAMLVGGCESSLRSLLAHASFLTAGINPARDPARACTPFARDRRGFVLAEGAGMLVLERLDRARARGARVLAVLAGAAIANEAYHVISPEPTGTAWARAMKLALADAGVAREQVDAISAHATGTPQGDLAETRAIKRVFGARSYVLPVSATKSMHGHAFGAAGAIETVLAIAAMAEGLVLPTINLHDPDPECDLDYVPHEARRRPVDVLLKNSFGAGGAATSLVLRRAA